MDMTSVPNSFAPAPGGVRSLLRAEALALLLAALGLYARFGGDWIPFAKLFLIPDVSMVFYLFGARIGAFAYNAAHSTLGAGALALFGVATHERLALIAALIWLAHIGFDRALGFGLKYPSRFSETHLGRIGRAP